MAHLLPHPWEATPARNRAAAATVGTAISTTTVQLLQRRNRPEADWTPWLNDIFNPRVDEPRPGVHGVITNAGDGAAFRVTVAGEHCTAQMHTQIEVPWASGAMTKHVALPFVPLLEPGAKIPMAVWCPVEDWDRAQLVVSWVRSPTRLRKRMTTRIPLRELAEPPPLPIDDLGLAHLL